MRAYSLEIRCEIDTRDPKRRDAKRSVDALHEQFGQDLAHHKVEHIARPLIAIVAVVGQNMRGTVEMAGRTFGTLRCKYNAIVRGSSESNISFVVEQNDMKKALIALQREFGLDAAEASHTETTRHYEEGARRGYRLGADLCFRHFASHESQVMNHVLRPAFLCAA